MRSLVALAAMSALTAGAVAAGTGSAGATEAASWTGIIKQRATSYTSPSGASTAVHHLEQGTEVDTLCYRKGQPLQGNQFWFLVEKDGKTGYVHRDAISVSTDLPQC